MTKRISSPPQEEDEEEIFELLDKDDVNNMINFYLGLETTSEKDDLYIQQNVYIRFKGELFKCRVISLNDVSRIRIKYVYDPSRFLRDEEMFSKKTKDMRTQFKINELYPSNRINDIIYCIFVNRVNNYFGFKIEFTKSAKKLIREDNAKVRRREKHKFPISPKVHNLLNEYEEYTLNRIDDEFEKDQMKQFRVCIENYFNVHFEHLLYDFEMYQHRHFFPRDVIKAKEASYNKPSFFYGYHHFMRFFLKFPLFLERDHLDESTFRFLSDHSNKLIKYVSAHFSGDLEDEIDEEKPKRNLKKATRRRRKRKTNENKKKENKNRNMKNKEAKKKESKSKRRRTIVPPPPKRFGKSPPRRRRGRVKEETDDQGEDSDYKE